MKLILARFLWCCRRFRKYRAFRSQKTPMTRTYCSARRLMNASTTRILTKLQNKANRKQMNIRDAWTRMQKPGGWILHQWLSKGLTHSGIGMKSSIIVEAFGMLCPTRLRIFFMFFFTITATFPFPKPAFKGLGATGATGAGAGAGAGAEASAALPPGFAARSDILHQKNITVMVRKINLYHA